MHEKKRIIDDEMHHERKEKPHKKSKVVKKTALSPIKPLLITI